MLLDQHIGFSGDVRWSGIPISLRVFHTVLGSTSQRLQHSQWNRGRLFSLVPLLSLSSGESWHFDLWIEKGVQQGYLLSPCLFNLYAEHIMRNAGLDELQAGIKIAGRNIDNLRYADDDTLMAESKEELKTSWWGWRSRVEKPA